MRHASILSVLLFLAGCASVPAPAESFDWAVGDWAGERISDDGATRNPMSIKVEPLPGGTGQIERMQVELQPRPYFSVSVRDRDQKSGRWIMVYTNASRPRISRLEGTAEGAGKVSFLSMTDRRGSRFVSERLENDRWRRTQYVSEDAGRSWKVLFVDELERSAAAQ